MFRVRPRSHLWVVGRMSVTADFLDEALVLGQKIYHVGAGVVIWM